MSITTDNLILIPTQESPETICDFAYQTALLLSKNKNLVIYFFLKGKSIKEIVVDFLKYKKNFCCFYKKNSLYFFNKIELIPFQRFNFIKQINLLINIFILKTIIFFISIQYKNKVVWIFHPKDALFFKYFKEYFSIYDGVDYLSSLDKKRSLIIKKQENLALKANLVTTISYSLYNLYKKKGAKVFLVPQGFALNEFKKFQNLKIDFIKLPKNKSLIGIIGAINYRLDFKLLINLFKNNPQWNFVFIGPVKEDEADFILNVPSKIKKIFSFKNCLYFPSRPKKYIPAIIKKFDICLIPYDIKNPFNKHCYPMKLFEYFYLGKPVISTPILELKRLKPYVQIAKNTKEFSLKITKILKNGWPEKYKKEQKKLAIANSWQLKIEKISQILDKEYSL